MSRPDVTLYCDRSDVEDVLSAAGVQSRLSDGPPSADDLGSCLKDAAIFINQHAALMYPISQLVLSNWVNFTAKHIAAHLLCIRRGNPAPSSVREFYDAAVEDLKDVKKGLDVIYDALPGRANVPVMSNMSMRLRPFMHSRVQAKRSAGHAPTDYSQRRDMTDPAEYGAADYQQ